MQFSQALVAALSISAASAMPVRHAARGGQGSDLTNFNKLQIRGAPAEILRANMLMGRAPAPEMVAAAEQIQALATRQSGGSGSLTSVLQVLSCLLDVLLGRESDACNNLLSANSTGNSTNGTTTAAARKELAGMLTDLSGFINSTSSDLKNSTATAKSNKKASKHDTRSLLAVRDATSINDVLNMLNNLSQLVQKLMTDLTTLGLREQKDAEDGKDTDDGDDASSTDFPVTPTATATDDASTSTEPAKTLTPTTTSDDSSSSDSAAAPAKTNGGFGVNCPNPVPNDGQYRPGCPGYGRRRRDINKQPGRKLAARDASQEQLKQVLPALATIIEAMPGLLTAAGSNGTANSTAAANSTDGKNGTSAATNLTSLADSNAYKKVVKQLNSAIGELNGNSTSTDDSASASATSSGDEGKASSTASASSSAETSSSKGSGAADAAVAQLKSNKQDTDSRSAVAAAQLAHGSRDLSHLLNADGFQYVRRANGDSDASQANKGGINVDVLNNLLNGLLSGRDVQARSSGNSDASQANQGGINVDLLNNLLNGLLSGRGIEERDGSQHVNMKEVNKLFSQILSGHAK